DAADPQMIVTVGDNAYQNGTQSDWDSNALAYYTNPMKRVTFFPTLGNHDVNNVGASNWANSVEIKMFAVPRNGTEQARYIVFDGHDHIYERTKYIDDYLTNGSSGQDGLGTTYIMTGGGGATLDGRAQIDGNGQPYRQPFLGSKTICYWLANDCTNGPSGTNFCSFATFSYTSVRLSLDTTLTVNAIDEFGNTFDTFTITKTPVTTT